MATKKQAKARVAKATARLSVSFPADLKKTLEHIAKEQKVSLGWVVRDAAEKYVSDRWPLLGARR
jgi:metal-responsive CopG/Arc/MetJ family transcriptional regulator